MTKRIDLTEGKPWKIILAFSGPLLFGNLLQQFYNIADSAIVGHFIGKEALAAVSASFFIYYFVIALVIGIGSGTTVVVSQLYGAKEYDKVQRTFSSLFIFLLIAGAVLSILSILLAKPIFLLTNTPKEILPLAILYFRIYMGGTFFFITFNSVLSILRGTGDSFHPMLFVGITTILNIVLDLFFILFLKWGVAGAAFATIIAQGIGMCISLYYINFFHPLLSLKKKDMVFDKKLFVRGLKIGLPTSVQQCAIAIGLVALLGIVNSFGTDTLTAYGAAGRIDMLITQAILTLSSAIAAFCGQNIGAKKFDRIKKGVHFAMWLNIAFSLIMLTCIYFFGSQMISFFTADQNVMRIGKEYLLITGVFMFFHGAMNVYNGALRGAGKTLFIMLTGIFSLWLIRIPLAYWLSAEFGATGIWAAISLSFLIGFSITYLYYRIEIKKILSHK